MRDLKKNRHSKADVRIQSFSDQAMNIIINCTNKELAEITGLNLADKLAISPSTLSRSFFNERGISFNSILLHHKLFRSFSMLLEHPELSVKEVAKTFGFCSVGYYIQSFRKLMGTTPSKYRKICTGDKS